MCTVSYIPIGPKQDFFLTSNRDEAPKRAAHELHRQEMQNGHILFPLDAQSKGSWIAMSSQQRAVCLLNGAFEKHERNLPYRKSRGLIVLDALRQMQTVDFFEQYDLTRIEAFTMIIWDQGKLFELRWNEKKKYLVNLDARAPHIWASATLYTQEFIEKRKAWFEEWKKEFPEPNQKNIIQFHSETGEGDLQNGLIMNRDNRVKTVSISSIRFQTDGFDFNHMDLENDKTLKAFLDF